MRITKLDKDLCDVDLGNGVVLSLCLTEYAQPGVWSVKIDGREYREPRDLADEPIYPGPFRDRLLALIAGARDDS